MTTQEQDKLWNDLSEEDKAHYREQYAESKTMTESGVPKLLEELFGSHNLNPKPLTYGDVIKELFKNGAWQVAGREYPREFVFNEIANDHYFLNCTSEEQSQKLLAINRLLNVAKYLNGDWKPDWESLYVKYGFYIDENSLKITRTIDTHSGIVYFHTKELAEQAIQILGEETVRLALSNDY